MERATRRLTQLYLGLALYGISMAFYLEARLGVDPWDLLTQGLVATLARFGVDLSFGTVTIATSVVVLLGWIPLRQRPGVGTVSNVLVIGLVVDEALRLLPTPSLIGVRVLFLVAGLLMNAVATACYIGARLGPGARDGLMTGIVARTGWPVRWVRMAIEVTVVAVGWLLGGNLGVGTVVYALAIGPLVHPLLPRFQVASRDAVVREPVLAPS